MIGRVQARARFALVAIATNGLRWCAGRLPVSAAMVAAGVLAASAQGLTLDGVWGNVAGCKFAKDGQSEDDSFVVLKSDGLQSYGTGCEWVQVFKGKNAEQVAVGLCGYEGEDGLGSETFVIAADRADAALMKIYAGHGELWGEVRKCQ